MAALNFQTEDTPMQLHNSLFETNGKCGYVSKPRVMWDKSHVMYRRWVLLSFTCLSWVTAALSRFNPWDKQFDGIHSSQFIISVLSGQYVCQTSVTVSVYVEVEIIGIQVDCAKQRTKVVSWRWWAKNVFTWKMVFRCRKMLSTPFGTKLFTSESCFKISRLCDLASLIQPTIIYCPKELYRWGVWGLGIGIWGKSSLKWPLAAFRFF